MVRVRKMALQDYRSSKMGPALLFGLRVQELREVREVQVVLERVEGLVLTKRVSRLSYRRQRKNRMKMNSCK